MNTDHLEEFFCVVKSTSISEAADKLFVSPSTLSKHIALLEKKLGFKLLTRSSHELCLTENGKIFYDTAFQCNQLLSNTIKNICRRNEQCLNISIHFANAYSKLISKVNLFKTANPSIDIDVFDQSSESLLYDLITRRSDLIIGLFNPNSFKEPYNNLEIDKIPILFAANNRIFKDPSAFDISMLNTYNLLVPSSKIAPGVEDTLTLLSEIPGINNLHPVEIIGMDNLLTQLSFNDNIALIPAHYGKLLGNDIVTVQHPMLPTVPLVVTWLEGFSSTVIEDFLKFLIGAN